jgi:hypothetical protein
MSGTSTKRKTLLELETTYKLHPRIRDVVVEGRDDASLLSWYLKQFIGAQVQVYAVDDRVEIPRELVQGVHRDINARGRVMALAAEAEKWGISEQSLTCVIDADYDALEDYVPQFSALLRTDYASMEVYSLQERPLSKFIANIAKSDISATSLVSLLTPAWATVYAVRYILHTHCDGEALVNNFAAKCINGASQVVADAAALLRASDQSLRGETLAALLEQHQQYLDRIPAGTLHGIRGHDIAPMLIRFFGFKNALASDETVEHLLRVSLEATDLQHFELFQALTRRVTDSSGSN